MKMARLPTRRLREPRGPLALRRRELLERQDLDRRELEASVAEQAHRRDRDAEDREHALRPVGELRLLGLPADRAELRDLRRGRDALTAHRVLEVPRELLR